MEYFLGLCAAVGIVVIMGAIVVAIGEAWNHIIDKITCPSCRARDKREANDRLGRLLAKEKQS
jgi:hypothetical protein